MLGERLLRKGGNQSVVCGREGTGKLGAGELGGNARGREGGPDGGALRALAALLLATAPPTPLSLTVLALRPSPISLSSSPSS